MAEFFVDGKYEQEPPAQTIPFSKKTNFSPETGVGDPGIGSPTTDMRASYFPSTIKQ